METIKTTETQKPSILIVDDISKNIQVLVNILRAKEYKLFVASSGIKALEMMEKIHPDLILLDVMMPEMDGFQVCQKLKASPDTKDIPIIFLTARNETESIVTGFEVGAVDYVVKPFNKAELLARVETQLALRKAQREIIRLEKVNAVTAMALTANHEINQPLTVLQGNLDLYLGSRQEDEFTDKQRRMLDKIKRSVQKITSILKKFSQNQSIQFESYFGNQNMVVFKEGEEQKE